MYRLCSCFFLFLAGSAFADVVQPDDVAIEQAMLAGWDELPGEFADDPVEWVKREKLVVDARLTGTLHSEANPDEVIIRRDLHFPSLPTGGQNFSEYTIIKSLTLPSGKTIAVGRKLITEEVMNRQLLYGSDAQEMSVAFKQSALSLALFGTAVDTEVKNSAFGGAALLDTGLAGAMALTLMLQPRSLSDELEGSNEYSPNDAFDCEKLANGDRDDPNNYSSTSAIGFSPTVGFSTSTFLTGPACFFHVIGDYIAAAQTSFDNDANTLETTLDKVAANMDGSLDIHDIKGPPNDTVAIVGVSGLKSELPMEDGGTVSITELRKGIDSDAYVTRSMALHGTRQTDGKTQAFLMESEWSDFRVVPGTALYEPYRQVLRVGGILSDAEKAQMAEAEKQLADLEKQMASMPASQRSMMEGMIGPQIEQIRSLASGGAVEFEIITTDIVINPELFDPENTITAVVDRDNQEQLLRKIQQDLETLGYDPGVLNGELTQQTVVAIERFEGDHGMPVTGQPSQVLASALAVAVTNR